MPKYSLIAAPLTDLLRNKALATKRARKSQNEWGDAQEQSFVRMKTALTSPEVLAFPDWNCQFTLRTDASEVETGAVLDQVTGEETFNIAFASHRFSLCDSRRGPTERECLAVLWAIGHFECT